MRALDDLYLPAGSATDGADPLALTPERCGWRYCGLRVARLAAGERRAFTSGEHELAIVPLVGGCDVECDGERFALEGRESVFSRVTDWAYVPRDAEVILESATGCELALPRRRRGGGSHPPTAPRRPCRSSCAARGRRRGRSRTSWRRASAHRTG